MYPKTVGYLILITAISFLVASTAYSNKGWAKNIKCEGSCFGTEGGDNLVGSNGEDKIRALDGNDNILGKDGDDVIAGNEGADIINAGSGNDRICTGHSTVVFVLCFEQTDGFKDYVNCGKGFDEVILSSIDGDEAAKNCEEVVVQN